MRIDGTNVTAIEDSGLALSLTALWFDPDKYYYAVGSGIHWKKGIKATSWSVYPPDVVTSYQSGAIRGSGLNDIFVAGSFLELVHFNGITWRNYMDEIPLSDGALGGLGVSENLILAVGRLGEQGVALIGHR